MPWFWIGGNDLSKYTQWVWTRGSPVGPYQNWDNYIEMHGKLTPKILKSYLSEIPLHASLFDLTNRRAVFLLDPKNKCMMLKFDIDYEGSGEQMDVHLENKWFQENCKGVRNPTAFIAERRKLSNIMMNLNEASNVSR